MGKRVIDDEKLPTKQSTLPMAVIFQKCYTITDEKWVLLSMHINQVIPLVQ